MESYKSLSTDFRRCKNCGRSIHISELTCQCRLSIPLADQPRIIKVFNDTALNSVIAQLNYEFDTNGKFDRPIILELAEGIFYSKIILPFGVSIRGAIK